MADSYQPSPADKVGLYLARQWGIYDLFQPGDVPSEPTQTYLLGNRWADYGLALAFALFYPLLRAALKRAIFMPLGRRFIHELYKDGKMNEEKMRKWNESCWKMFIYIVFSSVAFAVSYQEKWFTDARYFWWGCTSFPPCNLNVPRGVLFFFCMETGFYIQAIHFLTFIETRRKDWLESMIHHVATSGLLAYAYYMNFTRVGMMVILLHDVSDIFLEVAKLCRYAKRQDLATINFCIFAATWVVCRVLIFPLYIIRSCLTHPIMIAEYYHIKTTPHYEIFNALLLLLLVLHIYWTVLIFKVIIRELKYGNTGDIREKED